jgi:hypothetical protein
VTVSANQQNRRHGRLMPAIHDHCAEVGALARPLTNIDTECAPPNRRKENWVFMDGRDDPAVT